MLKVHGTGNTFYIVDQIIQGNEMSKLAVDLCTDGTDGVLFVCESKNHLAKMRIFNADGTEPEMCGNGLRCFARYILEKEHLTSGTIETLNAAYAVERMDDFYGMVAIRIELYPVKSMSHKSLAGFNNHVKDFDDSQGGIKLDHESFDFYTVSNPHVVSTYEGSVDHKYLKGIGEAGNAIFPQGINVNVLSVFDKGKIYVQTYERGVGITKSCGTGMTSASLHYAKGEGYFNLPIEVYNDGGMIICEVQPCHEDYKVLFTGNATYMAEYSNKKRIKTYDDEAILYENFLQTSKNKIQNL